MSISLNLFEIEIITFKNDELSDQIQVGAKFSNNLTLEDQGIIRFITQVGEVSIINLLSDGFPLEYNDIRKTLIEVINKRRKVNNYKGSWIGINDTVRYFADLSPQGYAWYWEYMRILDPVLMNKCELINRKTITPENVNISFAHWLSLSKKKRCAFMEYFLDNPVDGRDSFLQHIYEINDI